MWDSKLTSLSSRSRFYLPEVDRTTDSRRTQNINAETINAKGTASFSLGDISGTVANTINQLPSFNNEPHKQEFKELLTQLQTAVLATDLDDEDRQETLEQINALAIALTDSQNRKLKRKAKGAMTIIQDIAATLPSDSPMVTLCNQLPDLMGQVF